MKASYRENYQRSLLWDYSPMVIIIILGFILTWFAYCKVDEWQWKIHQDEFSDIAEDRVSLLKISFQTRLAAVTSLQSFFAAQENVSYEEFTKFTTRILRSYPDLFALEWLPKVSLAGKKPFELSARETIRSDFSIFEKAPNGRNRPPSERKEYYPIAYVAPYERNKTVLGFDEASDPEQLRRMIRARNNNTLSATRIMPLWRLSNAEKNRYGFKVFLPVYQSGKNDSTGNQRKENLKGFVAAVFHIDRIINTAFSSSNLADLELSFFAEDAAGNNVLINSYGMTKVQERLKKKASLFQYRSSFYIADQDWIVNAANSPYFKTQEYPWESKIVLLSGILLTFFVCAFIWAFAEKHKENFFRKMSLKDSLTGLYNRRGFLFLVEEQLKYARRKHFDCLTLFIDLDNFKAINDNYGHRAGDEILCTAAEILKSTFRVSDILARTGGDEFAVFALETSPEDEQILLSRLEERLQNYRHGNKRPYELAWSIGTAVTKPESRLDVEALLETADAAMYQKKKGKRESRKNKS